MLGNQVEVISAQTEDNLTGIVIDGIPYLYWLRVYHAFGLRKDHAALVLKRLKEGIHYVKFEKDAFSQLSGTVDLLSTVDLRAGSFSFLTLEGYNRAIMEIGTEWMQDKEIAAAIDRKKDEIANIYTRYQRGEILQIQDTHKNFKLPPLSSAMKEELARADAMTIVGVDKGCAASACLLKLEKQYGEDLTYLRELIPTSSIHTPPELIEDVGKGWYSLNAICKAIGRKRNEVYGILRGWGYMEQREKKHYVTSEGRLHGRTYDTHYQGLKGSGIKPVWYWDQPTFDMIEREFDIRRGQMTLTGENACGVSA